MRFNSMLYDGCSIPYFLERAPWVLIYKSTSEHSPHSRGRSFERALIFN